MMTIGKALFAVAVTATTAFPSLSRAASRAKSECWPFSQTHSSETDFVRAWFKLFDRNADASEFSPYLVDKGLEMRFPGRAPIQSQASFRNWYADILAQYSKTSHEVKWICAKSLPNGETSIELDVLWLATPKDQGQQAPRFLARQTWTLVPEGSTFKIREYFARPEANPSGNK